MTVYSRILRLIQAAKITYLHFQPIFCHISETIQPNELKFRLEADFGHRVAHTKFQLDWAKSAEHGQSDAFGFHCPAVPHSAKQCDAAEF